MVSVAIVMVLVGRVERLREAHRALELHDTDGGGAELELSDDREHR